MHDLRRRMHVRKAKNNAKFSFANGPWKFRYFLQDSYTWCILRICDAFRYWQVFRILKKSESLKFLKIPLNSVYKKSSRLFRFYFDFYSIKLPTYQKFICNWISILNFWTVLNIFTPFKIVQNKARKKIQAKFSLHNWAIVPLKTWRIK